MFKRFNRYEMLAQAQRDITAEKAAEVLRNLSDSHYQLVRTETTPKTVAVPKTH